MEGALEYVKRYISLGDYRSMIFVNKEWNGVILSMKDSLMLVKLLRYAGYMGPFVDKYLSKMGFRETLELFIETLEPENHHYEEYFIVYRPYNFIQRRRIEKRLNYLNLF